MKHLSKSRKAEIALARRSAQLAEEEFRFVPPDRLAQTTTDFIECRALSYWVRLIVETQGFVSDWMIVVLQERCPGFQEYAAAYVKEHPGQAEFLWLRFLEWADETLFHSAVVEGWRHALGYHATRDHRMDLIRAYWKQCRQTWNLQPPSPFPTFEDWFDRALQDH
jgi:hypothetical protein